MNKFSQHHALYAARLAMLVGGSFASAGAKDAHTSMPVSATVRAMANLQLESAPLALAISALDIRRGYIDVAQSTILSIHSNSASGYALEFMTLAPMFASITVRGFDAERLLSAQGGTVVQRWRHPQPTSLALTYRFVLAPGVAAGQYPWPLRLNVRPLESI